MVTEIKAKKKHLKKIFFFTKKLTWKSLKDIAIYWKAYIVLRMLLLAIDIYIYLVYVVQQPKGRQRYENKKITKFCKRTLSQPKSANYSTKTFNVFKNPLSHLFILPNTYSFRQTSQCCDNSTTKQNERIKSAIMLKKTKTRSVKKNTLVKNKSLQTFIY